MGIDFEAEGLLDGVQSEEARRARCDLLERLAEAGVSLEELKEAVAQDRLTLLPVELVLRGDERYTGTEIAEKAGVEVDFLRAQRRALGLPAPEPEERIYTEDDLEAAKQGAKALEAGLPREATLEVARVMGNAMASVSGALRGVVGEAFLKPGDTELEAGLRYAEAARQLTPITGPLMEAVLQMHQREQIRMDVLSAADVASGKRPGGRTIAVSFADLVGFTLLGEQLPPDQLGALARRLGELAGDVAEPPVRLIKMIGDAAMLVSAEPQPLMEATVGLLEAARDEGEDFPALRAGVAMGEALTHGGDWYGRPVNLASRLTAIARPDSALATTEVRDALGDAWSWSRAGRRRIKGIQGEVPIYRVRRPQERSNDD